jgi:hypothetical protein
MLGEFSLDYGTFWDQRLFACELPGDWHAASAGLALPDQAGQTRYQRLFTFALRSPPARLAEIGKGISFADGSSRFSEARCFPEESTVWQELYGRKRLTLPA